MIRGTISQKSNVTVQVNIGIIGGSIGLVVPILPARTIDDNYWETTRTVTLDATPGSPVVYDGKLALLIIDISSTEGKPS
jgi:hypothetical protein